MRWQYVASGMNHTIRDRESFSHPTAISEVRRMVDILNTKVPNSSYAILFNAFTEANLSEKLNLIYGDSVDIYCDSGGLQIITLGEKADDAVKARIYGIQAKHSDFAMSFDEIPQRRYGDADKSSILDMNSRFFDRSIHRQCAVASAKNLKAQIEAFKDLKTKSKPFLIIHGSTFQEYQTWADINFEIIGEENWSSVGGFACGSAGLGMGSREEYLKAFFASRIQMPEQAKKHIHFLGIGSFKRLCPMIVSKHAGFFDPDVLVSYDSTSHTCGSTMGIYYTDKKYTPVSVSRADKRNWEMVLESMVRTSKAVFGVDVKDTILHDFLFDPRPTFTEKTADNCPSIRQTTAALFLYTQIYHFMSHIQDACLDFDVLTSFMTNREYMAALNFSKVRDEKDLVEWEIRDGSRLDSKQIRIDTKTTLEDLFG